MEIDIRPLAIDMSLCTNSLCKNKCKRYQDFWKPNNPQSYINPSMRYDDNFNMLECDSRID